MTYMPSDFRCGTCSIRFTVGWQHYPSGTNGYGGMTHLMCRNCGTEHAVEIALRDRGPERFTLFDVSLISVEDSRQVEAIRVLQARFDLETSEAREAIHSLPMPIARRVDPHIAEELKQAFSPFAALEVVEVESESNPNHGPLQPDRFLSGKVARFGDRVLLEEISVTGITRGPNAEFDLDVQSCANCGDTGSLLGDPLEVGNTCPHCGECSVECVESWTT